MSGVQRVFATLNNNPGDCTGCPKKSVTSNLKQEMFFTESKHQGMKENDKPKGNTSVETIKLNKKHSGK